MKVSILERNRHLGFKIKVKTIIILLFLAVIYRPEICTKSLIVDNIVNTLRVIISIFVFLQYLKKIKISINLLFPVLIWLTYNIWCLHTETWTFSNLIELTLIVCVNMIVEIYIHKDLCCLNEALHKMLFFFMVVNIATVLLGIRNETLFLGFDNDVSMKIIPLIGVMLYLSLNENKKLTKFDYIITIGFFINFVLTWSVTSMVSILVMYGYIFCKGIKKIYIKSTTIMIGSIAIWVLLYVVKIQNYVSYLLIGLLKKDSTLSYRIYIWESVIDAIKLKPIFGYGSIMESSEYYNLVYWKYYASIAPHNFWLYICASAGIVGVVILFLYFRKCYKYIDMHENPENRILLGALIGYMLCGIFSSYYGMEYIAFLLAVAINANKITNSILKPGDEKVNGISIDTCAML